MAFCMPVLAAGGSPPPMTSTPCPPIIKPRVLTTAIDLDDTTASLERAFEVSAYFELELNQARQIAAGVGKAVAAWRNEAAALGLPSAEMDRMASAFEHRDLKAALARISHRRTDGSSPVPRAF